MQPTPQHTSRKKSNVPPRLDSAMCHVARCIVAVLGLPPCRRRADLACSTFTRSFDMAEENNADVEVLKELVERGRNEWVTPRRNYRARAHSNPLNDGAFPPPANPFAWVTTARPFGDGSCARWLDVGCGYGGLLGGLSAAYPHVNMLGMEIRDKVCSYCQARAAAVGRANLCFVRTNAMKYLPYYCGRASLRKVFFCYPDPHFKRRKNRQRIVTAPLLAEYAYVLDEGGIAYIVTDVEELFNWMLAAFSACPLFERRTTAAHDADPLANFILHSTDEAHKVQKAGGSKFSASFTRLPNDGV